jgi:hypothetical protein
MGHHGANREREEYLLSLLKREGEGVYKVRRLMKSIGRVGDLTRLMVFSTAVPVFRI